ncbi:MAG: amidohydrolase family protein [Bacteroidota bacterium]
MRFITTFILLFCLLPALASAQSLDSVAVATRTVAIEGARIVQKPGQVIRRGNIVIRDGLITAVGPSVAIPSDAARIDGDSLTVYAGFIDGLSHAGMPTPPKPPSNTGSQKVSRANPPNDRAGIQPARTALSQLDASLKSVAALRKAGFTVAHVVPQGRMLPGKGAIVLLAGKVPEAMILQQDVSLFAQLTGAQGVYPATPMGVMAKMRQLYREAARRKQLEAQYASSSASMPRPEFDAAHYAFFPVLDGKQPIYMHTTGPLDIYRALRLKTNLGYPLVLSGLYGGFESVDLLLDASVPLFLTLKMPEAPKEKVMQDSLEVDISNYDPSLHVTDHTNTDNERINLDTRRRIFYNEYLATAATLYDAGLNFGFTTKDVKTTDIHPNLRKMVNNGLSEDAALAALTTVPAKILGLSRRVGTVEKGKMGNLVVTNGPLFEEDTKILHVFVDGQRFTYNN